MVTSHRCSSNEDTSATGLLDSLLSSLGEKLGLDDDWDLGKSALTEDLEKSLNWRLMIINIIYSFGDIDNRSLAVFLLVSLSSLFWHEWPELVQVDGGSEVLVSLQTEFPHTTLSEVSRVTKQKKELLSNLVVFSIKDHLREPPKSVEQSPIPWPRIFNFSILTICSCWSSCGACHQQDLYHRDAFCAFQLYRVRVKRVLSTSWSFSILQSIIKKAY